MVGVKKRLVNSASRLYLIKLLCFIGLLLVTRFIFVWPIEYFMLSDFSEPTGSKFFSKVDGLKALFVVAIFFSLYFKDQIKKIKHPKINVGKSVFFATIGLFFVIVFYALRWATNYLGADDLFQLLLFGILKTVFIGLAFLAFLFSIFQKSYVKSFYHKFKSVWWFVGFAWISLYFALFFFQKQWHFFPRQ